MKSKDCTTVSVVTPSFNQGRFLSETIESVLSQAGDFYIDYLVIDGGSSDNSVDIIKRYAELLDNRLWDIKCKGVSYRWLSEKDRGQADAITKGFRLAEGEILAWLNSDDIYLPGTLSRISTIFSSKPEISVAYGKTYYTGLNGEVLGAYPTGPFDLKRLAVFNYFSQPSTFFRKSAFEAVGGLDIGLYFVMDYDLWIRMAKKFEFEYIEEFLATYRLHGESKTVSERNALANHEEQLRIARKYYQWAPLSRVYVCCHSQILKNFPAFLKKLKIPVVFTAMLYCVARYLYLNKGVRKDDLMTINPDNIQKLFKTPMGRYRDL